MTDLLCDTCGGTGKVRVEYYSTDKPIADLREPCPVVHPFKVNGQWADPNKVVWTCVAPEAFYPCRSSDSESPHKASADRFDCGWRVLGERIEVDE